MARFAELGELASVLAATRPVTWEAQDLTIALQAPADPDTLALVMLNARRTGHAIRWCPFRLHAGTGRYDDVVVPDWVPPVQLRDPPLPGPVAALLEVWRQWRDGDPRRDRQHARSSRAPHALGRADLIP